MKTLEFIYQETQIHFLLNPTDKNVMVNATEMAKIFNKEPKDFLRLEGTKKFIDFQIKKNDIVADVPRYIEKHIYYSNKKAGTFMCRKLALKFAAWLDVELEDWIFDTIDQIVFGNYKIHWDAHQQLMDAKKEEERLEDLMYKEPTADNFRKFREAQKAQKRAERTKRRAMNNQYKIDFGKAQ